jgi:hypothetical protein
LLKLLLSEQRKFHREEIKQEFVNHKLASRSESGQRLSLVSQALTRAKNDHLRQILNFDSLGGEQGHPGAHKENYEIRKEYRGLVEKVLRFNK